MGVIARKVNNATSWGFAWFIGWCAVGVVIFAGLGAGIHASTQNRANLHEQKMLETCLDKGWVYIPKSGASFRSADKLPPEGPTCIPAEELP